MLDKIFNTLIKLCVSVVILYSILRIFGINERSITAIILTIGVWHLVEWAIDNYNK
nr:MAG TPA: hypothetical protein [Caudoviricetes sp.]